MGKGQRQQIEPSLQTGSDLAVSIPTDGHEASLLRGSDRPELG